MNRSELISEIASDTGQTKKVSAEILDAATDVIMREIAKGNKVQILSFGTFELRSRKERKGRNPSTGKELKIPAKKTPAFKPGAEFKKRVI